MPQTEEDFRSSYPRYSTQALDSATDLALACVVVVGFTAYMLFHPPAGSEWNAYDIEGVLTTAIISILEVAFFLCGILIALSDDTGPGWISWTCCCGFMCRERFLFQNQTPGMSWYQADDNNRVFRNFCERLVHESTIVSITTPIGTYRATGGTLSTRASWYESALLRLRSGLPASQIKRLFSAKGRRGLLFSADPRTEPISQSVDQSSEDLSRRRTTHI